MEVLAERTRQALGLGDLKPTSLESHHKMLDQAGEFATHLRKLQKVVRTWENYTTEFLSTAGSFVRDTPFPMQWKQEELTQPAESYPAPIVAELGHLFDKTLQDELADTVPETIRRVAEAELMHPIELWLTAYESAKERMGPLESLRLRYDAARRRVSAEAAHKAAEVADSTSGHLTRKRDGGDAAEQPNVVEEAVRAQHKSDPALYEFEQEEHATWEHLVWLTNASGRLKAYIAHVLQYTRDAALGFKVPPNLLEAFPTHVLRVKEEAGEGKGTSGLGREKAPAGDEVPRGPTTDEFLDTAFARDQDQVPTPAVGGTGSALRDEGEVTGGSGAGAYRLVGQPSIGASEYLLVGGTAKEPGVVPSVNKAPDQPPEAVAKRGDAYSVITTHGVGSVYVEPAPAPHPAQAFEIQGSAEPQGSAARPCPGLPPREAAPEAPPVGDNGRPLNIDESYERAALSVAEAKAACMDRQEQQGQQGKQQQGQEQQQRQEGKEDDDDAVAAQVAAMLEPGRATTDEELEKKLGKMDISATDSGAEGEGGIGQEGEEGGGRKDERSGGASAGGTAGAGGGALGGKEGKGGGGESGVGGGALGAIKQALEEAVAGGDTPEPA